MSARREIRRWTNVERRCSQRRTREVCRGCCSSCTPTERSSSVKSRERGCDETNKILSSDQHIEQVPTSSTGIDSDLSTRSTDRSVLVERFPERVNRRSRRSRSHVEQDTDVRSELRGECVETPSMRVEFLCANRDKFSFNSISIEDVLLFCSLSRNMI